MTVLRCQAAEAALRLDSFDAVIDARSESEFALDHLPGAVNWPTLTDLQRHEVGTQYKQVSAFEARKRGAAMAARNIAAHLDREAPGLQRGWKPLVYCWRGGQRSGALAVVLDQVGFEVTVLEGGYRGFRRHIVESLEAQVQPLTFVVLCGTTGSGKSRLLSELQSQGAQVLDLEGLACHRGSVLGAIAGGQPSQKAFEMRLWDALRRFAPSQPVFVESESRTIGRLRVPEALLACMRSSDCIDIDMPKSARIELLLADYPQHQLDAAGLCERLDHLRDIRGHEVIDRWHAQARDGRWHALVGELLDLHYDPIYLRSMAKNFKRFDRASVLPMKSGDTAELHEAACRLLRRVHADPGEPPA